MKFFNTLVFAFTMLATAAFAGGIGIDDFDLGGLTQAQLAELVTQSESMKTESNTSSTIETMSEYAEFGKAFGSAIAQTANELGVVTNDFITTPAGKISVALIVWKVAGESIAGFIIGIMWFLVLLPIWWTVFKRLGLNPRWVITEEPQEKGKPIITKKAQPSQTIRSEADVWGAWLIFALVVIMASGLIILA